MSECEELRIVQKFKCLNLNADLYLRYFSHVWKRMVFHQGNSVHSTSFWNANIYIYIYIHLSHVNFNIWSDKTVQLTCQPFPQIYLHTISNSSLREKLPAVKAHVNQRSQDKWNEKEIGKRDETNHKVRKRLLCLITKNNAQKAFDFAQLLLKGNKNRTNKKTSYKVILN